MKQTTNVAETLFSTSHPQVYKHISIFQILVSFLIALTGIVAIVFSMVLNESYSTICMALLTVGVLLLLFAIYRFSWKSYETVYKLTGSPIRKGSLYVDTVELQQIQHMLEKKNFSESFRSSFKSSGNGRIDYMISKDGRFVAIQLLHFVPYTYEPVSDRCYYTDDDAVVVARCMNLN